MMENQSYFFPLLFLVANNSRSRSYLYSKTALSQNSLSFRILLLIQTSPLRKFRLVRLIFLLAILAESLVILELTYSG